ncbi:MAG TPA: DUF1549 domain-containing protein [Vicinamibacteria bacterium]
MRSARFPSRPLGLLGGFVWACTAVLAQAPARGASGPDFAREVQPILAAACVRCHSTALPQGQLRLDSREGLLAGGASGPVVVADNPSASSLLTRLVHADPQKRMPWMSEPLSPAEIQTLSKWVEAGAPWPAGVQVTLPAAPAPAAAAPLARRAALQGEARRLSFNRDVRPILADNCYACHGPDRNNRQMGLRLDREEPAKARLATGHLAIVAGRPDESEILKRILDPEEARRMPHVSSGKPRLGDGQVATLRRWIEEGAEWEVHWSYIPPTRPTPPPVKRVAWTSGAVDAFVLQHIEAEGLNPSPEASRRDLLRRLSFDLTGLPPTPEEARTFESDRREGAYERQVDRLLASPRFGERMAAYWLDLVRYSDSVGYHSDNFRPMWRYRDWVVSAFNRNLPFDRFTAEQLAGDLLPDAGLEQKIASGYNRLLQTTEEGGAQPKEYRAIYLADRVRNASTVWLGGPWAAPSATTTSSIPTWRRTSTASGLSSPTSPRSRWGAGSPSTCRTTRSAPSSRPPTPRCSACARPWRPAAPNGTRRRRPGRPRSPRAGSRASPPWSRWRRARRTARA